MRKLEDLLNIEATPIKQKQPTMLETPPLRNLSDLDKISAALPFVSGLGDSSDKEFDELAKRAQDAYDDLMDLGMNVEPRFSGRIFEVASSMLKNAIDAKTAKIDKKLKMIDLQLKKQRADLSSDNNTDIQGEGCVITDRNSLLEKLRKMQTD